MISSFAIRKPALRVLCVDDNEPLATVVRCVLEQAGHTVECVEDGQSALERVTSDLGFFDLIVTDHRMPRLSGLELITHLRKTAFAGAIVIHSARLSRAELDAYDLLAVDHILIKPVRLTELLMIVRKFVERLP